LISAKRNDFCYYGARPTAVWIGNRTHILFFCFGIVPEGFMTMLAKRGVQGSSLFVAVLFLLAAVPVRAQTAPAVAAPAVAAPADPTTAVPATAAPAADAVAAEAAAAADGGAYTVRLRGLERNVNQLKEKVFMTKRRLNLLKETVLGGVIGASRSVIKHKNEMGSSFKLVKAVYALDGVQIMNKTDESGRLAEMKEFDVYNGAIQPGSHTLSVQLVYQGSGYGVFSYLKSYKFNVKSSHTFVAGEGKATMVTVVGMEKGGVTTSMEDKPAVEFRVNLVAPEQGKTASN
jgi:hypothetical protein